MEALFAVEMDKDSDALPRGFEPMMATEIPGDPAHTYGVTRDPAFSDAPLNMAATETVGKMHDLQGIAPTDHNSGDMTFVGPVDHPAAPAGQSTGGAFGGGYGKVS